MNRAALLLLLIAVALTRLPLLDRGYGADPDAWRVASSAHRLWTAGEYEVSRYPGYPLHEVLSAPAVGTGGAAASNTATLLVALVLVVVWNRIALREARHAALLVITLACTPLFLRNAAVTMDYLWSLFFIVLALDRALNNRAVPAGIFIGLAAGFRMSNLIALVPVGVLFFDHWRGNRRWTRPHDTAHSQSTLSQNSTDIYRRTPLIRRLLLFTAAALGTTLVCYLPVLLTIGLDRWYAETASQLASVRQHSGPGLGAFVYRSIYAFGPLAVVGGALFLGLRWRAVAGALRARDIVVWSAAAAIFVYGASFLSLPMEREYLLPLLPFGLLLLDSFLTRPRLLIMLFLIAGYGLVNPDLISHKGAVGRLHPHLREGILLEECDKRSSIAETRGAILALTTPPTTIVVTGFPEPYWFDEEGVERIESPFHEQLFRNRTASRTAHIFALSPSETTLARTLGFSVRSHADMNRDSKE